MLKRQDLACYLHQALGFVMFFNQALSPFWLCNQALIGVVLVIKLCVVWCSTSSSRLCDALQSSSELVLVMQSSSDLCCALHQALRCVMLFIQALCKFKLCNQSLICAMFYIKLYAVRFSSIKPSASSGYAIKL